MEEIEQKIKELEQRIKNLENAVICLLNGYLPNVETKEKVEGQKNG